tara:strand:+ start:261 stop:779 length:519 start_codon:yes stop_codon:yes gene_type:complete
MTNDEWEVFKKEVKPIKNSGVIKKSIVKKTFEKKKIIEKANRRTFDFIDLEDNDQKNFQMDKNTIRKIKSGKIRISSILDLHSFTLKESKEKVIKFIEKNFLYGNRLNLIITGKGKRLSVSDGWKGDGKLKKNVPIWLSSTYLSKYILWFDIASPEKGGNGALFVYLKKTKE